MPSPADAPASLCRSFAFRGDPVEAVRLQQLGRLDPTVQFDEREVRRATHTPQGPATLRVRWTGERIETEAWGDGAPWVIERAPSFCGVDDRPAHFDPAPPWLAEIARHHAHVRLGRSLRLLDTVIGYVLQQRVKFVDAAASWRRLVERHGAPAPGPYPLTLPLTPRRWRQLPFAELTAANIDPQRARIVREVVLHAAKLDRLDDAPLAAARTLLPRLRGIGPWTAGMVLGAGRGDPDALPTGDVHLPHLVSHAFTGRPRGTDAQMLELLEPYRGQRFRVIRLLFAAGYRAPTFGGRRPRGPRRRDR